MIPDHVMIARLSSDGKRNEIYFIYYPIVVNEASPWYLGQVRYRAEKITSFIFFMPRMFQNIFSNQRTRLDKNCCVVLWYCITFEPFDCCFTTILLTIMATLTLIPLFSPDELFRLLGPLNNNKMAYRKHGIKMILLNTVERLYRS